MNNKKFMGIMPALVTPLCEDNKTVNEDVAKKLIDFQLGQGADGFYVLGGTGEGLVIDREQRERMCEISVKHVAGKKPVIMHIAAMNLDEAIALAKHAEKTGADAIAAVPPCFFFYDGDDLYNYYKKLASAVSIPLIIYYHPGAQKEMSAKLIARIFEVDNVTGVKWSSGNLYEMMKLKDITNGEMNIINGPDELLCAGLMAGADAGIGSTYNVMLPQFLKIYNDVKAGRCDEALKTQLQVNRVIDIMIRNEVIPAVKYATEMLGFPVGNATFPMRHMSAEQKANYEKELREVGFPFQ
ncbi:MAG: dihydrodipicolinate synthase family protein [Clostridia bacterium]|nr:dihydrodipicolinate synthase family protein [Clostridia bacterium]